MEEKEEEEEWKSAEIVFGHLIKIEKEHERITLEIKEFNTETEQYDWIPHWYKVAEDFDYKYAFAMLDKDVKLRIIDGVVTEIEG